MPAKRKYLLEESPRAYFYLSKIPHVTENEAMELDGMWNQATAAKADTELLLSFGIGRLLIWCNVVNFPVACLFRCPFGDLSSFVLQVAGTPETIGRIERELVGDCINWDKTSVCTTLLRTKYKFESELEAAGKC